MLDDFAHRGFLPAADPARCFPAGSRYAVLNDIGASLPERLEDPAFRGWARRLYVPPFTEAINSASLPCARLYYLRMGFLVSGFVNQTSTEPVNRVPENLATPLCGICAKLGRPPILSYDGYALYNWYRIDPEAPVALGNIDTIQNFVRLYDEHWFILVHVEIEAAAHRSLAVIEDLFAHDRWTGRGAVDRAIDSITATVRDHTATLRRIPERMSHELYFREFRPYIRFFEDVVYEGRSATRVNFRGETGAQSSVMPTLVAFFKIPHEPSALTRHIADMRNYMPAAHRSWLERLDHAPDVRGVADPERFNRALDAIAEFRGVHYEWAKRYVDDHVTDPRGTGGTPYMSWLLQLIDETRAHRIR